MTRYSALMRSLYFCIQRDADAIHFARRPKDGDVEDEKGLSYAWSLQLTGDVYSSFQSLIGVDHRPVVAPQINSASAESGDGNPVLSSILQSFQTGTVLLQDVD